MSSQSSINNDTPCPQGGFIETNLTELVSSFDDFNFDHSLLRGIYGYGWEKPTPIQQRAIKPMMDGRDTLAQAQSGTGKTGAFSLGALAIIDAADRSSQVLILSPTRELARQTYDVISDVGRFIENLGIVQCVGGTSVRQNARELEGASQIVVGTPGRLFHMISMGALRVDRLQMIILDEADEMLDRGFRDIMYDTFKTIPADTQVCLFSATYTDEIIDMTKKFLREPTKILVKKADVTLDGIKQYYVNCEREEFKFQTLCDLYEHISVSQMIIFCYTQRKTEQLRDLLEQNDFCCSHIHGGMTTEERQLKMKLFKSGSTRVLITTDLLGRGIDANVSLVLNYDLPHQDLASYIHRIGRSGRFGKKGLAINFCTNSNQDAYTMAELQRYYCTVISELPNDIAALED
jgi:translation initiation factor 4A